MADKKVNLQGSSGHQERAKPQKCLQNYQQQTPSPYQFYNNPSVQPNGSYNFFRHDLPVQQDKTYYDHRSSGYSNNSFALVNPSTTKNSSTFHEQGFTTSAEKSAKNPKTYNDYFGNHEQYANQVAIENKYSSKKLNYDNIIPDKIVEKQGIEGRKKLKGEQMVSEESSKKEEKKGNIISNSPFFSDIEETKFAKDKGESMRPEQPSSQPPGNSSSNRGQPSIRPHQANTNLARRQEQERRNCKQVDQKEIHVPMTQPGTVQNKEITTSQKLANIRPQQAGRFPQPQIKGHYQPQKANSYQQANPHSHYQHETPSYQQERISSHQQEILSKKQANAHTHQTTQVPSYEQTSKNYHQQVKVPPSQSVSAHSSWQFPSSETQDQRTKPKADQVYHGQNKKVPYKQRQDTPQGLPNIGNTCFLNSILQFVYGGSKFRDLLIDEVRGKEVNKNSNCAVLVGKLFQFLKMKEGHHEKSQILKYLVNKLQKLNLFYEKYHQEDALETLLNILNSINESLKKNKSNSLFSIETEFKCKCMSQYYTSEALYTTLEPQICSSCHERFEKKIINFPEYIVYTNDQVQISKLRAQNGEAYELVSQVIYMGSGKAGHYTCLRVVNGTTYEFNDSRVSPRTNPKDQSWLSNWNFNQNHHQKALLLLYQRVNTKDKPFNFSGIAQSAQELSDMDIQGEDYELLDENEEKSSVMKAKIWQSKQKQKHLYGDVYLNKIYEAEIKVVSKVFPNKKVGYKSRTILFKFDRDQQAYYLVLLNEFNFFYFQGKEIDFKISIQSLIEAKRNKLTLKIVIELIEEKLTEYFQVQLQKINYDRAEIMKLTIKDKQHSEIPYEEISQGAEKVEYRSKLE